MTKTEGDYYKGYPVINTDNKAPIIQELINPNTSSTPVKLEVKVPLGFEIDGIPQGRTPIVWGKVEHKTSDGQPGIFNEQRIVKVLDGPAKLILVPQENIHNIS